MITKAEDKTSDKQIKAKAGLSFPSKEIESCIRDCLALESEIQATLHSEPKQTVKSQNPSIGPQPTIDSLVCVVVLLEIESTNIVPFSLPESLIRAGGYSSVDEVVTDLLPRIKTKWEKHHGVKK